MDGLCDCSSLCIEFGDSAVHSRKSSYLHCSWLCFPKHNFSAAFPHTGPIVSVAEQGGKHYRSSDSRQRECTTLSNEAKCFQGGFTENIRQLVYSFSQLYTFFPSLVFMYLLLLEFHSLPFFQPTFHLLDLLRIVC